MSLVMDTGSACLTLSIVAWGSRTWAFDSVNFLLRDAGVATQHVSQTVVCDMRAMTPSGARRRVSYPMSDSLSCRRRANEPPSLR